MGHNLIELVFLLEEEETKRCMCSEKRPCETQREACHLQDEEEALGKPNLPTLDLELSTSVPVRKCISTV